MPAPDVTICIPAWQAEPFIARTLQCARAQTHADVRILVSVDRCDDATAAICGEHAAQDPRIEVIVQRERLGWSENANALLDRVDTEFYFLYFHDDIIEPVYVAQLRQALLEHPEAKSAHCDLERFGKQTGVDPGNDYRGSACRRLLNFMLGPVKGTPLRSLTRTELLAQGLRFPAIGDAGFWRCHPFLFHLLGAGPAVRVPEVLYRRWFRDGSMTTQWNVASLPPLLEGQRASAVLCGQILDDVVATDAERQVLRFALYVFIMTWTRQHETRLGGDRLIDPARIAPAFAEARVPDALAAPEADMQDWLRKGHEDLLALERRFLAKARERQDLGVT
jgi:hypothetical protein